MNQMLGNKIMKKLGLILFFFLSISLSGMTNEEIQDAYYKSYNYEKMENYVDAIKALLPVYKAYPEGYTANLRLGWLYYLNKNYANSLEQYENAIKISPYSIEAKLGHLLPLLAQDRYSQVEKEAFQILNIDYYNYYANLRLVFALRMQKKYDNAESIVLKMLAIYPIDVSFLTEYALLKHFQEDIPAAVRVFNDILILDPENVTAKEYLMQ